MSGNLIPAPNGDGGAAPAAEHPAGLFERLVGHLDRRDQHLLETMRAETAASIDAKLQDRQAGAVPQQAMALALHAAAEAAGAHDVETVDRLIDRQGVAIDNQGAVAGAKEAVERLKAAKPFLFGRNQPTGGTAKAPKPGDIKARSAKDLTPAEWLAEKRRLGVRS
jgi:hypothetical protein